MATKIMEFPSYNGADTEPVEEAMLLRAVFDPNVSEVLRMSLEYDRDHEDDDRGPISVDEVMTETCDRYGIGQHRLQDLYQMCENSLRD